MIKPVAKKAAEKSGEDIAPRARLHKLTISNFRCIGPDPVTIELDDIVVLVGPNNSGKSSVLRAYELVMESGKAGYLVLEDFPNAKTPVEGEIGTYPTIELETVLFAGSKPPAEQWIEERENGDRHVRERWTWKSVGAPDKRGYNVELGAWDQDHGPWGLPSVAQINRPEVHRIEAFDNPEKQGDAIISLLQEAIKERVKEISAKKEEEGEPSAYGLLMAAVKELQKEVAADAVVAIEEVKSNLNRSISEVFPGYAINLDARPEEDIEKAISLFKSVPMLRMGPADGHQSTLDRQGSGARRTLLWTALRILAEHKRAKPINEDGERPHVLLLDEPEMCLHPNAIRDACNVLYSLPDAGKWQVMVTTHSPVFLDLSRNNTSIVRVERGANGVSGTTIFRPAKVNLSPDDRENLKLLNMYDPYVGEFFFGGRTVIVEGDTEYTAFKEVINTDKKKFGDVHIVRARGKFTIIALCKILNHFGSKYAVLHDSDRQTVLSKKQVERANPAWNANQQILEVLSHAPAGRARLVASVPNFEEAMFGEAADGEKPFGAWEKVRGNEDIKAKVAMLLAFLLSDSEELPDGALNWTAIPELEAAVNALPK
jgi:putative ATP-dependent endonuclease of OLD family